MAWVFGSRCGGSGSVQEWRPPGGDSGNAHGFGLMVAIQTNASGMQFELTRPVDNYVERR
jgi:hypothetical protein